MKTKTYFWILSALVLLVACVWILWNRPQVRSEQTSVPATKTRSVSSNSSPTLTSEGLVATMQENDRHQLEAEGNQLVKEARKALEAGDEHGFDQWIVEIVHRYKGDPNPLLLEFSDVLKHKDPKFRKRIAGTYLRTNLKVDEALKVLRDIVRSNTPLIYGPEKVELLNEEFPGSDYRFRAADTLALFRIEIARDDIWDLYVKTGSTELIQPLRRLNHPRMIEKLKKTALNELGSIESMKLIGEFQMKEALPELMKNYEDKNSSKKVRFRTLYPLWRITGDEKYFDEFAASFSSTVPVPYLAVGGEKERQYLVKLLRTAQSDTLIKAVMALHLRFNDNKAITEMLLGYYRDPASSNWKDGTLARRLVGSINDPELNRVAEEYERKYQTGFHDRYAVYRKNWRYPEWEETLFLD